METKNNITDGLKEIKSSFEANTLKANLTLALEEIKNLCVKKEYIVEGSIDNILSNINFEKSTLTSRKKLARKIYYFLRKKSLKTMSSLLSFIRKAFLGEEFRVSVKPSILQQEINVLREKYKKLYKETEEVRIAFKEKKKIFNEKNKN